MSYLVFARKWRPKNFDEIIGQEHIATTLKNAIAKDRVAHAYLFAGPRGVGKTSTARILAKALNCQKGPNVNPCNRCDSCLEINESRSLDVIEIDGASNRGIEQIRQLRENVKFAPAKSRYKIYIIDEVHQITTDGFNALLKTLEEPPAHIKFVFATTQAHKVLPTIISRCQRFDFKPLSAPYILKKLKHIVKTEKLDVTEDALMYVAKAAVGSMRDAESILDQLGSFCKGKIELEAVSSMLGMVDTETLWQVTQKIIEGKSSESLLLVEEVINQGKDLVQFIANLMEHFRNILIAKTVNEETAQGLIDLPSEHITRLAQQAKLLSLEEIFYIFNILAHAQETLRRSLSSRVSVEMVVLKLTQREKLSSLENILARIESLEKNLGSAQEMMTSSPAQGLPVGTPAKEKTNTASLGAMQAQDVSKEIEETPDNHNSDINTEDDDVSFAEEPSFTTESLPDDVNYSWHNFLQAVREEKMFVASSLEFGEISSLKNNVLTISFPKKYNFYKESLERGDNKKVIQEKAKEIFRRDLQVKFVLDRSSPEPSKEPVAKSQEPAKKASTEPIIKSALKIFQGRIISRNNRH
ncbi:MAG: DNA polymerase III subunit gamma/tau [Candidatus Omnitrophica bacterium]|nr:DNA polymerase III subunit gamma/tau [Candidatus Omnitrophota bacterium]